MLLQYANARSNTGTGCHSCFQSVVRGRMAPQQRGSGQRGPPNLTVCTFLRECKRLQQPVELAHVVEATWARRRRKGSYALSSTKERAFCLPKREDLARYASKRDAAECVERCRAQLPASNLALEGLVSKLRAGLDV